jgi:hypothetical protein
MLVLTLRKSLISVSECMNLVRMKKYDMTMVLVGVIWAIIILVTIVVSWDQWNVVDWVGRPIITEILLIEVGGAIGSIIAMWMGSSPSEETVNQ